MPQDLSLETLSELISDIYDCAIHPEGWEQVLTKINTSLNGAYTAISMADKEYMHPTLVAHSPWDRGQLERLHRDFAATDVVGARESAFGDVDAVVSTLNLISESEFQQSRFYREWAGPQGLRDGCLVKFADTATRFGQMVVTTSANRDIITAEERRFMVLLSPHLRRAALIGDLLDNKRVETQLYRSALDRLTVAVFLVDADSKIMYANERADSLLSAQSHVLSKAGMLTTVNAAMAEPMADTIRHTGFRQSWHRHSCWRRTGRAGCGICVATRRRHRSVGFPASGRSGVYLDLGRLYPGVRGRVCHAL
jgi:PAS domain-containing protein